MSKTDASTNTRKHQKTLLGGITAKQFLREYWQKKPLLVKNAIPGFTGLLDPDTLAGMACEQEVQSRLVRCVRGKWLVEQGPFEESRFASLPVRNWTLLVQSVNHHLAEASQLLQRFNFIPHARLDDLMVSYAPDGGGVGPHFDSYDVFLLQGLGKRKWRISQQQDLTLIEGAPLRILKNFVQEKEYVLEAGDMLYLPPHVAHWGIAEGDCMTYSIGFRAPVAQELGEQFLGYLQEHLRLEGRYADLDLALQKHPGEISEDMVSRVSGMLKKIRWNKQMVADFLGTYLSEPKQDVVFNAASRARQQAFTAKALMYGLQLDLGSQALFFQDRFFINGEQHQCSPAIQTHLRKLADHRQWTPVEVSKVLDHAELASLVHGWFSVGYLQLGLLIEEVGIDGE